MIITAYLTFIIFSDNLAIHNNFMYYSIMVRIKGKVEETVEYRDFVRFFNLWRAFDLVGAFFALIGVLFSSIDYESKYSPNRTHDNCEYDHSVSENLSLTTLLTTFFALVFISFRYFYRNLWLQSLSYIERNPINEIEFQKRLPLRRIGMYFEICILMIFPYPYLQCNISIPFRFDFKNQIVCYRLSELLYCVMFLRFWFLLRAIADYSNYQNHEARSFCRKYNVKSNIFFSFRCLLRQYPMFMILIFCFASIFFNGIICRILGRPLDDLSGNDFSDPVNSMWFIFETISTLGFGEITPISDLARADAVITFFLGSIVISLLISVINGYISLSKNENKAFTEIRCIEYSRNLLKIGIPYLIIRRFFGRRDRKTIELHYELRQIIDNFRRLGSDGVVNEFRNEIEISELHLDLKKIKLSVRACSYKLDTIMKKFVGTDYENGDFITRKDVYSMTFNADRVSSAYKYFDNHLL